MGHRITQRILDCSQCETTPEDGSYLWEMCGEFICEKCIEKNDSDEFDEAFGKD